MMALLGRQDKKVPLPGLALLGCLAGAVTCFTAVHVRRVQRSRSRSGKKYMRGINQMSTKEVYIRSTSNDLIRDKNGNSNGTLKPYGDGENNMSTWQGYDESGYPIGPDPLHTDHSKEGKLIICMVGLPGRGKTYVTRKVARYLRWIGYKTRSFSLARYRIDQCGGRLPAAFYDHDNEDNLKLRDSLLIMVLDDMMAYLSRGGECVILDSTSITKKRRDVIRNRVALENSNNKLLWIESATEDEEMLQMSLQDINNTSPDFLSEDDFQKRVAYYKEFYETVDASEGSYVKLYDFGKRIEVHDAQGYLLTRIMSFLMNLTISSSRPVYMTRHGESQFNIDGKIGGNPGLSNLGHRFAEALMVFVDENPDLPQNKLQVWSSTMKRARQTSNKLDCKRYIEWRELREIEVGICDGLTYEQVQEQYPKEYAAREIDKLNYRYPRGESYLDIINRLEPVIFEIERQTNPLLIVAHQAVLRCLYTYFIDLPNAEAPYLSIPLHCVIKLTPQAFGCSEKRFKLFENAPDGQLKI